MRILLITRSYPRDDDLYQYPFVHRRVLAYRDAGHEVQVIQFAQERGVHSFEGVECRSTLPSDLSAQAQDWAPDVIAIHGMDEHLWPAVADLDGRWPVCAWLHGSEIPAFFRDKAHRIENDEERASALRNVERRVQFWRSLTTQWPEELGLAFVSEYSIELMRQDLGNALPDKQITVIHNPIDTNLFAYHPKSADDRFHILSIRPYASPSYGNDLAVSAVLALAGHRDFSRAQFSFIGDGPMFDDVLAPLRRLPNVTIRREFLPQEQIAQLHRQNGLFLVPTRLDTQGVSRDEAMASGLVPITNATCSIPEFVDEASGFAVPPDDATALARALATMFDSPRRFLTMSANAADRVRQQSANAIIIPLELAWMESRVRDAS